MQRSVIGIGALFLLAVAGLSMPAAAQMNPGGGQGARGGRPGGMESTPETYSAPSPEKPDAAASKAYKAGMKSLSKARDYESAAAAAQNPDKKAAALEKMGDAYYRALDQFTEALSNKGDMVEAWNEAGYVHLRVGAYGESVDDYNHALTLKPDLTEAIAHRAEALLGIGRLGDVKSAYMDLFNHERPLADVLMTKMQAWVAERRADPQGVRASDLDAFGKWLDEREGIAKQTAALPH